MKKQIQEKVEHLDDEKVLEQVLAFLNNAKPTYIDVTTYKDKIFRENDDLFKRLA